MRDRTGDYLRFTVDLRSPFDNNRAEVRHEVARDKWIRWREGRQMLMSASPSQREFDSSRVIKERCTRPARMWLLRPCPM
jgi:hypothetical protein